ncbi:LacI family DNA-binding transcriptional regulator [Herbidospora daliensis]|uniref:LacI family DNA-binding transcriptional regulator n=1 Tax=Herbidospora daliensis TaxID=295585 RepID=UPI0007C6A7D5|nr:LacI family DNA-binding transcriptional regulator [Herbidospora daliensis]
MSVTVRDIAHEAGVSVATVSRALRGLDLVKPETRRHILDVADRMNYIGSSAAAALSTGRTNTIGIVLPSVGRWSFGRMMSGIERELRPSGMDMLVHALGDPSDPHPEPHWQRLASRVDAILVMSVAGGSRDVKGLTRLHVPVAVIGTRAKRATSLLIDDRAGARTATEHLIELGHRRIGLIYGRDHRNPLVLEHPRYLGYVDALHEAGIRSLRLLEVPGNFTVEGGVKAMNQLMALRKPPTAVFAMSDEMAFGAISAMRAAGLRPGWDISLVGFDGHDMAALMDLTTVEQPLEELGAQATRALLRRLADSDTPVQEEVMPTSLVVRGTTRPG